MSTQRPPAIHTDDLENPGSAFPWQDLVAAIYHHRRTALLIFSIGVALSMLWGWITPPVYRAKALLMVKDQRAQMNVSPDGRSQAFIDPQREDEVNSLMTIAYQPALLEKVIIASTGAQTTDGDPNDDSWVVWAQDTASWLRWQVVGIPDILYRKLHGLNPPTDMEMSVANLRGDLQFIPLVGSNLVEIGYYSRNPRWAAKVANTLTTELIAAYTRLYESEDAHRFYQNQRTLLADTVSKAEADLVAFRERVGSDLLSLDIKDLQTRVGELEVELIESKSRRAELESQMNAPAESIVADAASHDTESGTVGNPAIGTLKSRLLELEIQRSELLSRYAPKSAAVREINRQIAEVRGFLEEERATSVEMHRRTARSKLDATDARIAAVEDQLTKYHDTIERLEKIFPEWSRLQNNAQTQKEAYMTYLRKEEEARISSALDESQIVNIAIAERASVPSEPESGRMKRRVVFGAAFSAILALGVALLRDWMDPSVKSGAQAERIVRLPVLGELQS